MHTPVVSNSTTKFLGFPSQLIATKFAAVPPVWVPVPIITFTIPNSSVVVTWVSWYSNWFTGTTILNLKQMVWFTNGDLELSAPGSSSPFGFKITAW